MAIDTARRRPRIFHGWYIVAFAFAAQMVAGPYVFGVFVKPMTEELGWSRGERGLPTVAHGATSQSLPGLSSPAGSISRRAAAKSGAPPGWSLPSQAALRRPTP